jgi:hypothetical protein
MRSESAVQLGIDRLARHAADEFAGQGACAAPPGSKRSEHIPEHRPLANLAQTQTDQRFRWSERIWGA